MSEPTEGLPILPEPEIRGKIDKKQQKEIDYLYEYLKIAKPE